MHTEDLAGLLTKLDNSLAMPCYRLLTLCVFSGLPVCSESYYFVGDATYSSPTPANVAADGSVTFFTDVGIHVSCPVHVGEGRVFFTTYTDGSVYELDTLDPDNVAIPVITGLPDARGIAADVSDQLLFVVVIRDYIKCYRFNGTFIRNVASIIDVWGIVTDQVKK